MIHKITLTFMIIAGFYPLLHAESDFGLVISGERKIRHTITFTVNGPACSENGAVNPFTDYRLSVRIQYVLSGQETYIVPGYFAADGNAGQTGADSGSVWKVHFTPQWLGAHIYTVSFRSGPNIALSDDTADGEPVAGIDGDTGSFDFGIGGDEEPPDLRAYGRVDNDRYKNYMVIVKNGLGSKPVFLKFGASSPSNFLDCGDFDNTPASAFTKTWADHAADWHSGDTTWGDAQKGKGIIGAINYLSSKGINTLSFNTLTLGGTDPSVFPYTAPDSFTRFDCSKLDQWQIVFDHANSKGIAVELRTQIAAAEKLLDDGECGPQRKLYYRELISRFAHNLGVIWNLGDENGQTTAQRVACANLIREIDPHRYPSRPILLPVVEGSVEQAYMPLLLDTSSWITGISLQSNFAEVHDVVMKALDSIRYYDVRLRTVTSDCQTPKATGVPPDGTAGSPDQDAIRKNVLWGCLMAGGAGVTYYFGENADLSCENFKHYEKLWDYNRYALSFFRDYLLENMMIMPNQLSSMTPSDGQLSEAEGYCLSSDGYQPFAVYLPNGGTASIDLTSSTQDTLRVWWYNPRSGGKLQSGARIVGSAVVSIGAPPADADKDWAALIVDDNLGNPDEGVGVKKREVPPPVAQRAIPVYASFDGWVRVPYQQSAMFETVSIIGIDGKTIGSIRSGSSFRLKARGVYLLKGVSRGKKNDGIGRVLYSR
ncbi:MAG: DUF5060 domain-containing protein [Chitinispirillaceae bacterium]|nr:DUF5060 domain-containing protein [Chitinispirillaceae bacterium]